MKIVGQCDSGVIAGARGTAQTVSGRAATSVLVATILGSSMVFIDSTVVNIALPVIQADLHATAIGMQWVVNAYTLFLASLLLVGGSLGDHYGRKRFFIIGAVLFALSSAWCGFASDVLQLAIARGVQGVGSAMLTPGSLSLISANFEGVARGRAVGTWSAFTAITAAIGPALGGWIVQYASWRWIFFINIPLAIVVIALTWIAVPESHDRERVHKLDYTGALLATLGLGATTYGLVQAGAQGFGALPVIGSLALGVVALAAFIVVEARSPAPMMPLRLFQSRTFSGVNALTFLLYAALAGVLYFLPFNLIQVQHYTPTQAGFAMLPFIALLVILSPWAGGLVARIGPRLPLIIGPAIAAGGFAVFLMPGVGGNYWTTFFPAMLVLGLGMALTVAPLTTTVFESVDAEHVGVASAINNAVSRAAGLLAVAVLNLVVINVFSANLDRRMTEMHAPPAVAAQMEAQRTNLAAAQVPAQVQGPMRAQLKQAILHSYVAGFRAAMIVAALLALAGALVSIFMISAKRKARETGITSTRLTGTPA